MRNEFCVYFLGLYFHLNVYVPVPAANYIKNYYTHFPITKSRPQTLQIHPMFFGVFYLCTCTEHQHTHTDSLCECLSNK